MLLITKEEVAYLRDKNMDKHIFIHNASHGSKCKTYYAEENSKIISLITNLRNHGKSL